MYIHANVLLMSSQCMKWTRWTWRGYNTLYCDIRLNWHCKRLLKKCCKIPETMKHGNGAGWNQWLARWRDSQLFKMCTKIMGILSGRGRMINPQGSPCDLCLHWFIITIWYKVLYRVYDLNNFGIVQGSSTTSFVFWGNKSTWFTWFTCTLMGSTLDFEGILLWTHFSRCSLFL